MAISTVIYLEGRRTLENEVYKVNSALLQQVQASMDYAFNDVSQLAYRTGLNNDLSILINRGLVEGDMDRALLQDIIKSLAEYRRDNSYSDEMYIYLKDTDLVLSANGLKDPLSYFDLYYRNNPIYGNITYESWRDMVSRHSDKKYLAMASGVEGEETGQTMLFLQSVPFNDAGRCSATIVVRLNTKALNEIISGISSFSGSVGAVMDADGVIFHTGQFSANSWNISYGMLQGDSGMLQSRDMNGQKMAISYIRSRYSELVYVMAVPYSAFWDKVAYINRLSILSILACFILGGVLAYVFTRRNYNPVGSLLQLLGGRAGVQDAGRLNEYEIIHKAMDRTLSENEIIVRQLDQSNTVLKSVFLGKLLKGRIFDSELLRKGLETYGIAFPGDRFAVMLFCLIEQGSPGAADGRAAFSLADTGGFLQALTSGGKTGCFTEIDDMIAGIVNFGGGEAFDEARLAALAYDNGRLLGGAAGRQCIAAASSIHETVYGIPAAYQEALSVMDYKITTGNDSVLCSSEIRTMQGNYAYSLEAEQQLINSIKAGNQEAAGAILDNVFRDILSNSSISYDMVKCLMFDVASTILKTIPEIGLLKGQPALGEMNIAGRLLECRTAQDMKKQMSETLAQDCSFIRQNRKPKRDKLIDSISDYVSQNYGSMDLNVSFLADRFQLSPTYLTHIFKERTDENLYDYISRVRIEEAKKLLRERRMEVKDIAVRVGYLNSSIFIRAFKKAVGVTPGGFRDG